MTPWTTGAPQQPLIKTPNDGHKGMLPNCGPCLHAKAPLEMHAATGLRACCPAAAQACMQDRSKNDISVWAGPLSIHEGHICMLPSRGAGLHACRAC
jgi:hypothetical protein